MNQKIWNFYKQSDEYKRLVNIFNPEEEDIVKATESVFHVRLSALSQIAVSMPRILRRAPIMAAPFTTTAVSLVPSTAARSRPISTRTMPSPLPPTLPCAIPAAVLSGTSSAILPSTPAATAPSITTASLLPGRLIPTATKSEAFSCTITILMDSPLRLPASTPPAQSAPAPTMPFTPMAILAQSPAV